MKINFPKWNGMAGLFCVEIESSKNSWRGLNAQFIICKRKQWLFGYEMVWYNGAHHSFGLGPLFIITWEW